MESQYYFYNKKEEYIMPIVYVKNEFVKMLWDAEGFFESKTDGFLAAVQLYEGTRGTVAVMFRDNKAFIILDPDTEFAADREELFKAIKDCHKSGLNIEDYFYEQYVEFSNGVEYDEGVLAYYGLDAEDGEDMNKRLEDLQDYWQVMELD